MGNLPLNITKRLLKRELEEYLVGTFVRVVELHEPMPPPAYSGLPFAFVKYNSEADYNMFLTTPIVRHLFSEFSFKF